MKMPRKQIWRTFFIGSLSGAGLILVWIRRMSRNRETLPQVEIALPEVAETLPADEGGEAVNSAGPVKVSND